MRVARRAALEEIQCCHAETHALVYGTDMVNRCTLTGSQELNRDNRYSAYSKKKNDPEKVREFMQDPEVVEAIMKEVMKGGDENV